MTDDDRMTDDERRLRAELRETLVPPPVSDSLRASVDALAEAQLAERARTRRSWGEVLGMGTRRFGVAAGAVAVLAAAVMGVLAISSRGDGNVAATPPPTRPAATQPAATQPAATQLALPDPTGAARIVNAGAWIDATTAWATTQWWETSGDSMELWMTTDGGQTWSERGPLPPLPFNSPPTFLDALHGYQLGAMPHSASDRQFQVNLTTDGGRSWHASIAGSVSADPSSESVPATHFTDPLHGVVLATIFDTDVPEGQRRPTIACAGWSTDDGGQTWAAIAAAPCWSSPIQWASPTLGVMVSSEDGAASVTFDGGRHWTAGALPAGPAGSGGFQCQLAVEPSPGIARIGGYYWTGSESGNEPAPDPLVVLETRDGGASWQEAYRSTSIDAYTVRDIAALGSAHWLAAIPEGSGATDISETLDGGRSWTWVGTLNLNEDRMTWIDRLHGAAPGITPAVCPEPDNCSGRSTVLFTNDGGLTWHDVPF